MDVNLSRSVLATITYYDVFNYPLTAFEIWKYLLVETSHYDPSNERTSIALEDIVHVLETESIRKNVRSSQGFYFLEGRRSIVDTRLHRGKLAIEKMRGVRRLVFFLRFIPFVRMVALTGSLAMKNSSSKGDWDLLIVLRAGHIWTGRALLTTLLHLFRIRRHGEDIADRACLNFWITTKSLNILMKDVFSSNEYFFITPLFGFQEFKRFQSENMWIRRFRPNYEPTVLSPLPCMRDSWLARITRDIGEIFLSDRFIELKLSVWQKKKINDNPKTHQPGSLIEATDEALIFLPKPQGPLVFEKFKRRMSELNAAQW